MERLKALGSYLTGVCLLLAIISLIEALLAGTAWISDHLLPWFSKASLVAGTVLFLVLLPLSVVKRARPFSGPLILLVSFIFGITLWMEGFLVTLSTWGTFAVIFGLFFAGIGVVPIAILASIIHRSWAVLMELVILAVFAFGCRIFAFWLMGTTETAVF